MNQENTKPSSSIPENWFELFRYIQPSGYGDILLKKESHWKSIIVSTEVEPALTPNEFIQNKRAALIKHYMVDLKPYVKKGVLIITEETFFDSFNSRFVTGIKP